MSETPTIADGPSAALTVLRAAFPDENIGKLPRITCGLCRESKRGCNEHRVISCGICRQRITSAHIHLDYVGHAETTDRLLSADPSWFWEPMALDAQGLPAIDAHGGLWIRLTVAGVSRLGYGHAERKPRQSPGDHIKELIGDSLRNAAMRFGVALDLWAKTELPHAEETPQSPEPSAILGAMADLPAKRQAAAEELAAAAVETDDLSTLRRHWQAARGHELGDLGPVTLADGRTVADVLVEHSETIEAHQHGSAA